MTERRMEPGSCKPTLAPRSTIRGSASRRPAETRRSQVRTSIEPPRRLQHTGGGTVIEAEQGDGGAAYGVEVRSADGTVVEIALDGNFRVVGQETDDG